MPSVLLFFLIYPSTFTCIDWVLVLIFFLDLFPPLLFLFKLTPYTFIFVNIKSFYFYFSKNPFNKNQKNCCSHFAPQYRGLSIGGGLFWVILGNDPPWHYCCLSLVATSNIFLKKIWEQLLYDFYMGELLFAPCGLLYYTTLSLTFKIYIISSLCFVKLYSLLLPSTFPSQFSLTDMIIIM